MSENIIKLEGLDERGIALFQSHKLFNIMKNVEPTMTQLKYMLLTDKDKECIKYGLYLQEREPAVYDFLLNNVKKEVHEQGENTFFLKALGSAKIPLRDKMLQFNQSAEKFAHYCYVVPGPTYKAAKNILYLNTEPKCYLFKDNIIDLLNNLSNHGFGQSLVFSVPSKHTHWYLGTQQIDAIYHQLAYGSSIKDHPQEVYDEIFDPKNSGTNIHDLESYVKNLPINDTFADLRNLIMQMEEAKYATLVSTV